MIFFDQFKVGNCFAEFMIPITLRNALGSKELLRLLQSLCEDALAKRISLDIYTPLEGRRGTSSSRNGKLRHYLLLTVGYKYSK